MKLNIIIKLSYKFIFVLFQLLSVHPTENSLSLVYRDKETLKFVKHINNRINEMTTKGFYDISSVYRE